MGATLLKTKMYLSVRAHFIERGDLLDGEASELDKDGRASELYLLLSSSSATLSYALLFSTPLSSNSDSSFFGLLQLSFQPF
jgi:hypothetical protein